MPVLMRPWGHLHYQDKGSGPPVIFANSLGTDLRMWQDVTPLLPGRRITFDKRGHGLSATPEAPWTVQDLAADVLALMDHLELASTVMVGCSVGGMVAQAAALAAPARVRGLVLSNCTARMGTPEAWAARIAAIEAHGIGGITDMILERWFPPAFRAMPDCLAWRTLLVHSDQAGYIGTCQALALADLRAEVPRIACPVLMLTGDADLGTPPAQVRETAALIPGARVELLEGSGHIPAIDAPARTAALIAQFLRDLP
ncbi:3-oxoadipate enol-lactonase [bacterium]|nr:3-oxoadipate enol-lactonase [bacterium]